MTQFEHASRNWKYENEQLYFEITAPVKVKGTKDDYELKQVWRKACGQNGCSPYLALSALKSIGVY